MGWQHFKQVVTNGRFWLFALLFSIIGFGLTMLPHTQKAEVRQFYVDNFDSRVRAALQQRLSTTRPENAELTQPTTQASGLADELADCVKEFCCPPGDESIWGLIRNHQWQEVQAMSVPIIVTSFLGAYFLVLIIPPPLSLKAAMSLAPPPAPPPFFAQGTPPKAQDSRTPDIAINLLRSRQLRAAVRFAVISGAITVLIPPTKSIFHVSYAHQLALLFAATLIGAWSSLNFSSWNSPTTTLAAYTGFSSVFFSSLIAFAITLPYQSLTPEGEALLHGNPFPIILVFRFLILPSAAWFGAFISIVLVRRHYGLIPALIIRGS
jgi:hypothetical protein